MHTERVHRLFKELSNKDFWISINEINEEIVDLNTIEQPTKMVKLNILTQSIINYDTEVLSEAGSPLFLEYRPFFVSFIIYVDRRTDREYISRIKEMGNSWYIASFKEHSGSGWYRFSGELETSASPVIYKKRHIYISDITLSGINDLADKTYKISSPVNDTEVCRRIHKLLEEVYFNKSRIYKIGNGNLIAIKGMKGKNTFQIMYDVGYHSRSNPGSKRSKYTGAILSFRRIKPDAVFLSHWDDDHIMGAAYGQKDLFECPWFAPEIVKSNDTNARRLARYLSQKGKLTIIERRTTDRRLCTITSDQSQISLYLGINKKIAMQKTNTSISKENCGGLIIEIKNDQKESVFCGDVPYDAVRSVLWDSRSDGYDILVVPHHGSKMDYTALKIKKNAKAIVSGNKSKKPGRPDRQHKEALEDNGNGYNVMITEDAKRSWIDVDL